jgi:hypothetical protein
VRQNFAIDPTAQMPQIPGSNLLKVKPLTQLSIHQFQVYLPTVAESEAQPLEA